jgi:hypothetical protein
MWGDTDCRQRYLDMAIDFTSDHELYGHYMMRVVREWPISCENALTDPHMNHKAWVGHAACALAMRCPEDIVRQAWAKITDEQKHLANQEAKRAIEFWRERYIEDQGLREHVAEQVLL